MDFVLATESPHSFPKDFIFGAASSSYQYEGAVRKDGKGTSIWDTFTMNFPGKIRDGSNGYTAVDQYYKYKEDVAIMRAMGLKAYRFSICWPRILPGGKLWSDVNREGIKYYNNLIDELLANGIEPFVTLFHWDSPQSLEDEYGGFLSEKIVKDFHDYAELCFWEFGDRVKYWATFNEPWTYCFGGYTLGTNAPGRGTSSTEQLKRSVRRHRCHPWHQITCTEGDPGREPYRVAHNILLAHADVVELYRTKYKASQGGQIGMVLNIHWMVPLNENNENDIKAASRALDFWLGWFLEPITMGEYPESMKRLVKDRLPIFTPKEAEKLKKSIDYLGLNYYSAEYVADAPHPDCGPPSLATDPMVEYSQERNGIPIGTPSALNWLYCFPEGIHKLLMYVKNNYNVPTIYITENGWADPNNIDTTPAKGCDDEMRITYHKLHLKQIQNAIEDGVNVKGYFVWSLLDNYEWNEGYTVRFGLVYVDYKNGYGRFPKKSARWFMDLLKSPLPHPVPIPIPRKRLMITENEKNDSIKRIKY